jgi:predicted RNase H-like HicB family nuclease
MHTSDLNVIFCKPRVIAVTSYVFTVEFAEEDDGRWSAWIEALPGCATWGYTQAEALAALQEAAQAYVEVLLAKGQQLPSEGVQVAHRPRVAVTRMTMSWALASI